MQILLIFGSNDGEINEIANINLLSLKPKLKCQISAIFTFSHTINLSFEVSQITLSCLKTDEYLSKLMNTAAINIFNLNSIWLHFLQR